MKPERLFLDFETYSDIDITEVGVHKYATDESTEALLLAYAFDDDEPVCIDFTKGEKIPKKVLRALLDPDLVKSAWNAPFEIAILRYVLGLEIDEEQWEDTMVLAYACSFPGSLAKVSEIAKLDEDSQKKKYGKRLINIFSKPQKPKKSDPTRRHCSFTKPKEWRLFIEYCITDVKAERSIWKKLRGYGPPRFEHRNWVLDQKINNKGIPVNRQAVEQAIRLSKEYLTELLERLVEVTGLENPNSRNQMLAWLQRNGYPYDTIAKADVTRALKRFDEDSTVGKVLRMRQELGRTSVKKFDAYKTYLCDDDTIKHQLQYGGAARTGREAGRGVQPQNLPKPVKKYEEVQPELAEDLATKTRKELRKKYPDVMDYLSSSVRPVIKAPEGFVYVDTDLSAIENVVLGWLSDEEKILDTFRAGRDAYLDFAVHLYGEKYEDLYAEFKAGNKLKRTISKPGTLGCGYRMGAGEIRKNRKTGEDEATGLLAYAWNMGVSDFTLEQSKRSVDVFRKTYTKVVKFWDDLEAACRYVIETGGRRRVRHLVIDKKGPFMRMILPSGRALMYFRPRIEVRRTPWGAMKPVITYEGPIEGKSGSWGRTSTHSGKLVENACQAVAKDILFFGMRHMDKLDIDIRLHVHDQVLSLARIEEADEALVTQNACMSKIPKWAPGLVLKTAGHLSPVFIKD